MQEKGVINTNQFIWLLFCIITSFSFLHTPGLLIIQSGRDSWLAVVFAWFIDVLLAVVYAYMGIRFPGQNMAQYSMTILGNKIGRVIGMLFPIFFLLVSALLQFGFSTLINVAFFPKTPVYLILIFSYLVIGYAVHKGVEVVGRVCEILGPIYLISIILMYLFIVPDVDINNIKPQLEHGLYPALSGAPIILSFIGICIIMGLYIPICDHPENGFLAKFAAVTLGASMISMLVMFSIGAFSVTQANDMFSPSLRLARLIHISLFFQRMEIIWLMIAIGAVIVSTAEMIWAFCLQTSQVMGLSTYKPLVFPAILISFVISITSFKNSVDLLTFLLYTYPIIAMFVETGLEMLLFFTALLLKKRG